MYIILAYRVPGLSPRGRGKPDVALREDAHPRSIPAWAGETVTQVIPANCGRVYPRVGGGNHPRHESGS